MSETGWLIIALLGFALALLLSTLSASRQRAGRLVLPLIWMAAAACAVSITLHWIAAGHGPFLTLYEVLLSNVFSLGLIAGLVAWRTPLTRVGLRYSLGMVLLLGVWAMASADDHLTLPATFASPWLWVHVGFGKLFLGFLLVAVALALTLLIGRPSVDPELLDGSIWRYAGTAFVFDSAMLLSGAVWANDAWGRYWNWDPVETWALITWLVLGLCLHGRLTWNLPQRVRAGLIAGVFLLAFLTLFGVPFLSYGPHKGIL